MNLSRILAFMLELEERFPVNDWRVGGVRVWPYLRCRLTVSMNLAARTGGATSQNAAMPVWHRRLRAVADKARRNAAALPRRLGAQRLNPRPESGFGGAVYYGDGISFAEMSGRMYEKIFEPLAEALAGRGLPSLMLTPGHAYPAPCRLPQAYVQPGLDLAACRGILSSAQRFEGEELHGLDDCLRYASREGPEGGVLSLEEARKGFGHLFRFKRLFTSLLRRGSARLGLCVDFEGEAGMAFTLACRELGLAVVALQHGAQPADSALYSHWDRAPETGYELLPTHFWVRAKADAEKFEAWMGRCPGAHEVVIGGFPFLRPWLEGRGEFVRDLDEKVLAHARSLGGERHVLVALNGLEPGEDETVAKVIESAAAYNPGFRFWLRSHPCRTGQGGRLLRGLSREARALCTDKPATELPLYALFRHTDALLTLYSSTAAEAASFGLGTVLLHELGMEVHAGLVSSGRAVFAASATEALQGLEELSRKRTPPGAADDGAFARGVERLAGLMRGEGADRG